MSAPPVEYVDERRLIPFATQAPAAAIPESRLQTDTGPAVIPQEVPLIALGHALDRAAAGLKQGVRGGLNYLSPGQPNLTSLVTGKQPEGLGDKVVGAVDRFGRALGMGEISDDPRVQQANEEAYAKLRKAQPAGTFIGDTAFNAAARNPLAMAGLAGLEYGTPEERAVRAGLTYGLGKGGETLASALVRRVTQGARLSGEPVRDATIQAAREQGYVIPPTQIDPNNPGWFNRLTEGFSGKIQTAQQAAIKNQQTTNRLAARDLGLPDNTPITPQVLNQVRSQAGTAYDVVRNLGTLDTSLGNQRFATEVGQVISPYLQTAGQFPGQRNPAIDTLIRDISQTHMEAGAVVDLIRQLRAHGFKNINSEIPATADLGRVQLGVQDALENLLEENLARTGQTALLDNFRAARVLIAKTHTVENALETSTGKVLAPEVAKTYGNAPGKLTGGLATIGRTAEAFPKALQKIDSSMPGLSPLDFATAILSSSASGHPAALAAIAARPAVRASILSEPYQRLLTGGPLANVAPATANLIQNVAGAGAGAAGATEGGYMMDSNVLRALLNRQPQRPGLLGY